jgi:hypothetical protein
MGALGTRGSHRPPPFLVRVGGGRGPELLGGDQASEAVIAPEANDSVSPAPVVFDAVSAA